MVNALFDVHYMLVLWLAVSLPLSARFISSRELTGVLLTLVIMFCLYVCLSRLVYRAYISVAISRLRFELEKPQIIVG